MDVDVKKLLKAINLSAQITLENGGETYRAEETIKYVGKAFGAKEVESIVTPTGIYITISIDGIDSYTVVKRIKKRSINLDKLNRVNNISRQLTNRNLSLDDAIIQLEEARFSTANQNKFSIFYGGFSAAFFTLLFGGEYFEFFIALISGILVTIVTRNFDELQSYQFFSNLTGGMIISSLAILSTYLANQGNYNNIIVGGMMPLLPGLSMTNAIRDTIRGDLISGMARGLEALLVAASLATGAGTVMSLALALNLMPI